MQLFGIIFLLIFFVLPAAVVGIIIYKLISKQKASEWTGKLVDKKHMIRDDPTYDGPGERREDVYSLVFDTNIGTKTLGVGKPFYDKFNVGDSAVKKKGAIWPEKV